jgi:thioredoxin-related protein
MVWAKALAAVLTACALILVAAPGSVAETDGRSYQPIETDSGLLAQPWYLTSFLELQPDLEEAAERGKRFMIMWEQPGCPYCERMHEENFVIPAINDYVRKHFAVLQLNLRGDRRVTDFDGEVLAERKLARKYGVTYTPTLQFFPADPSKTQGKPGHEAEVERVQGYLKPVPFLATFKYVDDKTYREIGLREYFDMQAEEDLKRAGFQPEAW